MMRILILCPNWVGDVVMATPTFRAIRNWYAEAEITCLARPYVADVLAGAPWFDELILHAPGSAQGEQRTLPVLRKLRRLRFDLAVLLTNSWRSAALAWLAGAKRRVGYSRDGRGMFLTDRLSAPREGRGYVPTPAIDYYLKLAYYLGCPSESYGMEIFTTREDEACAAALWRRWGLDGATVVALNSGGAFGSAKAWPAEYFAQLARRLAVERSSGVLILCGPKEREMARGIATAAGHPRVFSLADEPLGLGLTKACVRRCDLLVTTDSGPRHFAAALGVPVVTLFGPTHIAWTETYYAKAIHLQTKVPCGPCQLPECPLDHRCMRELSVAEVYDAAVGVLDRFSRPGVRRASA